MKNIMIILMVVMLFLIPIRSFAQEYLQDTSGNSLVGPYFMHGCEKMLPVVTHYCGIGKGIAPVSDDSYVFRFQHGIPLLILSIKPGSMMAVDPSKPMTIPAICAIGTSVCGTLHTPIPISSPTLTPIATPSTTPTAFLTPTPSPEPTPKNIIVHHRFIK